MSDDIGNIEPGTRLNEEQTEQVESLANPPSKPSQIPTWAMGMAMGEFLAADFVANDPAWSGALEGLGMTEEQLGDLLGGIMTTVLKEVNKSLDFYEELDDEEKSPAEAAVAQLTG